MAKKLSARDLHASPPAARRSGSTVRILRALDGLRDVEPEIAQAVAKCLACDAEDLGGVKLVTTGEAQRAREQDTVELIVCFIVQALGPLLQSLKNERVEIELGATLCRRRVGGSRARLG